MLIVALGTLCPLLLGIIRGEPEVCIFGSLMGYCLGICGETGSLSHRFGVLALGFTAMTGAFALGVGLQDSLLLFLLASAAIVYLIGVLFGRGGEIERLLVLTAVHFYVARYAPSVKPAVIALVSLYVITAFLSVALGNLIAALIWKKACQPNVKIRQAFSELISREKNRHIYALTYAAAVTASILIVDYFKIERGYWTIITVLLIMKPIKREIVARVSQRVFGTLAGILLGELLIIGHLPLELLALVTTIFATLVPYFWYRNYWLVAVNVTVFVIGLLEIAALGKLTSAITLIRLEATLYGCAISLAIIYLFPKSYEA